MSSPNTVSVHWFCGYYVGPFKWQNLEDYEPDECESQFETEEEKELWDANLCNVECPICHNLLYQSDDHAELINS